MKGLVQKVTADEIATILIDKGFRAEKVEWVGGREALRSAASGISFNVVMGNGANGVYHDFTYFVSFRLEGLDLLEVCTGWNQARRFARLHTRDGLLNMEMDVMLGTGVDKGYIAVTTELWNQLLNELLASLREMAAKLPGANETAAAVN